MLCRTETGTREACYPPTEHLRCAGARTRVSNRRGELTASIVDALRQHLDAAERGDASSFEHHDLRRELTQFGGVVADVDHRNALVAQADEIGQDLLLAALIERAQRLVQQQQAWL